MRTASLFFLIFQIGSLFGQDTTFRDRELYLNYVYGGISSDLTSTGFLLDRVPFIENDDERFALLQNRGRDTLDVNAWIRFYKFFEFGKTMPNEIRPIDSLTWPVFTNLLRNQSAALMRFPLMVMDFDMNRITREGLTNGNIIVHGGRYFEGDDAERGIETKRLGISSILLDTIVDHGLVIYFDSDYMLTNRSRSIVRSEIEVNGGHYFLEPNNEIDVSRDLLAGENILTVKHYFDDGSFVIHYFRIFKKDAIDRRTLSVFDEQWNITGGGLKLEYGIKLGNGNTDLTKPVYFVSGFGPASAFQFLNNKIKTSLEELYVKYNMDNLMGDLLSTGHDIIVVKFDESVGYIQRQAELLIQLINGLNERKFENNSRVENVFIGYSAGAITVKYALDKMEFNHVHHAGPHHHSRLFISFEGEHQGANVPLGAQHATEHMKVNNGCLITSIVHYLGNSPMAKQMLIYFHSRTGGQVFLSYANGQGAHSNCLSLLHEMEQVYVHPKQLQKYGYFGYPAFTRNVTISNATRTTEAYKSKLAPDVYPYSLEAGGTIFKQTNLARRWLVNWGLNNNYAGNGINLPHVVFRYLEGKTNDPKYLEEFKTDTDVLVMDMTAGGFLFGNEDAQRRVFEKMAGFCLDGCLSGSPEIYEYRLSCFTPLFSCLDIKKKGMYIKNQYADFSPHAHQLMRYEFSNAAQGNYGYPCLGHPTDHFGITPFEGIYCAEYNQEHVDSKLVSGNSNDVESLQLEIVSTTGPGIKQFILSEIQPVVIYLQNRKIGWNTLLEKIYEVDFVAGDRILVGERVTPSTDIAPFVVLKNGKVECRAENSIRITAGFHVEAGGVFHGRISSN